jgi:hypothetical protein
MELILEINPSEPSPAIVEFTPIILVERPLTELRFEGSI